MATKSSSSQTVISKPKISKKGRPKVPFRTIFGEFTRRRIACEGAPTLEEECRYLTKWAKGQRLKAATKTTESTPLAIDAIRKRIIKRIGGRAARYKQMRAEAFAERRRLSHVA